MAQETEQSQQEDHEAAYVFVPQWTIGDGQSLNKKPLSPSQRPRKRRRVQSKRTASSPDHQPGEDEPNGHPPEAVILANDGAEPSRRSTWFVPLLGGAESEACVRERERVFWEAWGEIDNMSMGLLRDANRRTLDEVSAFIQDARTQVISDTDTLDEGRIPAAFIIMGPNNASQSLLFQQLSETLQRATPTLGANRFVSLKSAEIGNLKVALKTIIRSAMNQRMEGGGVGADDAESDEEELEEVKVGQGGRKYLDYDLEALAALVKAHQWENVFIALEDSEGFDGGLLSDLIHLLSTWRLQIPFTLLFGVATSVDLLQARLLKSTVRCLYGAQFDVAQAETIVERVFRSAIAGSETTLQLGPSLLRSLFDRQRNQVAGIKAFISSLKYAYMCHFYANPLSAFLGTGFWDNGLIQPEHLEAVRLLPSFRARVEAAVESEHFSEARALLEDDDYLSNEVRGCCMSGRRQHTIRMLRSLLLLEAIRGNQITEYSTAYLEAIDVGIDPTDDTSLVVEPVRRLQADEVSALVTSLLSLVETGDASVGLDGWPSESLDLVSSLESILQEIRALKAKADENGGGVLRSKYTSQSKTIRATVVAKKVQLSQDSAGLTDEDKAFTDLIDRLVDVLTESLRCPAPRSSFLHETWLYDSRFPLRDALVPRPRLTFERSLRRPHDYLNCACCRPRANGHDDNDDDNNNRYSDHDGGDVLPTLPPTALLYHLYLETGNLINVADLWSAFFTMVGNEGDGDGDGYDERTALVMFYQGLAELKAMGFVKPTRRKVDHIAKIKWL